MDNKSFDVDWGSIQRKNKQESSSQGENFDVDWGDIRRKSNKPQELTPLGAEWQWVKGIGKGSLEKLSQFGASAANLIPGVHVNPLYQPSAPESEIEASGRRMGPGVSDFLALLPPLKAAKLIAKAPEGAGLLAKLLQSGKKIGAVGTAGALEGLTIGEPNRFEKAKELGIGSAEAEGIGQLISKALSFTPSGKYKTAQSQFQSALQNQLEQEQALKKAKAWARKEAYITNPEDALPNIKEKNNQISEAIDKLNELPTQELPSSVTHAAHTQLPRIAEDNLNNLNHEISVQMGAGSNPDKPLAESTMQFFEGPKIPGTQRREGGLRTEIGNIFNEVRDSLGSRRISIQNKINNQDLTRMAEAALKKLFEGTNQEVFTPTQMSRAKEAIKADLRIGKGSSINAQTYFDDYRDLEDAQGKIISTLSKAKNGKIQLSDKEIRELKHKASNMQSQLMEMESNLTNQLSPEILERFQLAKDRWANEYAPVRNNPIYQQMREKGTVSSRDFTGDIRGEDRGSVILRRYFQTNPDAASLLANYQYADNPMALQSLTPYQSEFINPRLTPHISRLIEQQAQAINNVGRAQQQAEHFEQLRKNIQEQQKAHNKALEERRKIEEQIPRWQNEIAELEKHEKILTQRINNKRLSDSEVEKAKSQLKESQKKKERASKLLGGAAKYYTAYEYTKHGMKDLKQSIQDLIHQERQ